MMNEHIPYLLYANCIPVKGAERSTICDLQRNRVHLIPNTLFDLLMQTQGQTLAAIKARYNHAHDEVLDDYFSFLRQEELIFQSDTPERFPPLSSQWQHPSAITNAILDLDRHSDYDIAAVVQQLDHCNCKYLELRSYYAWPAGHYDALLEALRETTIISAGLLCAFESNTTTEAWMQLCDRHQRVTSLVLHSSPYDKELTSATFAVPVTYTTKVIKSELCCGIVSATYFSAYKETFTEALQHNSCLNRKLSIDSKGYIRNCPSMKESFGHIGDTTLLEAIEKPGFKKHWYTTKDKVSKCKDCEFRYVCTDCRAYLEQPEDPYSAPLKCGYDPYTCTWEAWSNNPMKQKAIDHYGMQEPRGGV